MWSVLIDDNLCASATTLVSVRNTQVFRMALTALTEPRTLWRRISRFPSPRRWVALHSISKMYFRHWKPPGVSDRMWSVNLDASISGEYNTLKGIPAGFQSNWERWWQAWECRRQAWEHLESQSCIQVVFSSMYLCIYIATHLHTLYLNWLHGGAWEQFEMRLRMTIEWAQRYTPRLWSSDFGDALWDGNWAYLAIHLEAVIKWT